jgi:urea-proton symporter
MAYKYGVSGSFWYAAGATVQVLLFAVLAIELKKRAPNAHTFLEIVYARYGKATHIIYLCFALATNIVSSAVIFIMKKGFHTNCFNSGGVCYASAGWKCSSLLFD